MIFADNCFLFATSKEEIRKMITDTEELRKRGLDWKDDQIGDILLEVDERKYRIK